MQWSHVKLAGNKRTLDAVGEDEDTSEESGEEREDGEMSEEDSDDDCYPGPEGNAAGINGVEFEVTPPEPNDLEEQLDARPREQMPSRLEISVEHTNNTCSDDLMRREAGQTVGGSQGGLGQPPNKGELPPPRKVEAEIEAEAEANAGPEVTMQVILDSVSPGHHSNRGADRGDVDGAVGNKEATTPMGKEKSKSASHGRKSQETGPTSVKKWPLKPAGERK